MGESLNEAKFSSANSNDDVRLVKSSYEHFTDDLGELPSPDDILYDILDNYDQDIFQEGDPYLEGKELEAIKYILRSQGLEYRGDFDESLNEDNNTKKFEIKKELIDNILKDNGNAPIDVIFKPDYYYVNIIDAGDKYILKGDETNVYNMLVPFDLQWRIDLIDESLNEAKNKNYRVELYYYDNNKPDDVIYFENTKAAYNFCNNKISDNADYDDGLTGILVFNETKDKLLNTWQNGSRGWENKSKALTEAVKPLSNYSSYRLAKLLTDKYYDLTMGHEDKMPFLNWFDRNFGANNRADAANIISNFDTSTEKRVNRDDLFYVKKYVDRVANLLKSSNVVESLDEAKNDTLNADI